MAPPDRRLIPLLLLALAGCASGPEERPEDRRPVKFAVIAAPEVGRPAPNKGPGVNAGGEDPLSAEDLLLEAVTQLSADPSIEFTLVPGPLLVDPKQAEQRDGLIGGLGSLAGPVLAALAKRPQAKPKEDDALLEGLKDGLKGHEGKPGYWGKRFGRVRPVAVSTSGEPPEDEAKKKQKDTDEAPPLVIAVRGAGVPGGRFPFEVTTGPQVALTKVGERVTLTLPPLHQPPHLYGIVTIDDGEARLSLHRIKVAPPGDVPKPPPPVRLWPATRAP